MQIDKQQIIDLLRQRGDTQQAEQADQQLPQQVDPQEHSGLLEQLGLNPADLISKFMSGGLPGM